MLQICSLSLDKSRDFCSSEQICLLELLRISLSKIVWYQYSGIAQGKYSAKEFSTLRFLLCKMGLIPAYFTEVSVRISL